MTISWEMLLHVGGGWHTGSEGGLACDHLHQLYNQVCRWSS